MKDDLKSRIETLCIAQESARQVRIEHENELTVCRTRSLDRFVDLRQNIIRSAMNEFVCYFSDRFYNCRIVNDDDHNDQFGRRMYKAGITFRLYKGADLTDDLKFVPHYSVFWDEVNGVVRFYRSSMTKRLAGEAGYDGKSDLHGVTSDLVEGKLLRFTSWLFDEDVASSARPLP